MGEVLNYDEQTGPLAEVCRLIVTRLLQDGNPITPAQTMKLRTNSKRFWT